MVKAVNRKQEYKQTNLIYTEHETKFDWMMQYLNKS